MVKKDINKEHLKWISLSYLGGALMLIGATTGNFTLYFLIAEIVAGYTETIGQVLYVLLYIFGFIAQAGGTAVIIGTSLIFINHHKLGKIISNLGTGVGLIGLLLLVILDIISGTIFSEISVIIMSLTTITGICGLSGLLLSIYARKKIEKPEKLKRLKLSGNIKIKDIKRDNIPVIILITIYLIFFALFEISAGSLFTRLIFMPFTVIFLWEATTVFGLLLFLILSINYKHFRAIILNLIMIVLGILIILLSQLESLIAFKAFIIVIFVLASIGSYFSLKDFKKCPNCKNKKEVGSVVLLLALVTTGNFLILTLIPQEIIITPRNSPELIFWIAAYDLPDDNETMKFFKQNGISFMPVITPGHINKSEVMNSIKLAISNGIYLHFVLFITGYYTMDNAHLYPEFYRNFRGWLVNESVFQSPYIKSFSFDGEPPTRYQDVLDTNKSITEKINYFIINYPTKEEIENVTKSVNELVNLIQNDGKEAGLIRTAAIMDHLDFDGDLDYLFRNVYPIEAKWNFSITMLYRIETVTFESINGTNDFLNDIIDGINFQSDNVMSPYTFYYRVGLEQSKGDINTENRYIFIGNFGPEFNQTSYIQNKEYLFDLDVCRHFSVEKVFFYSYDFFIDSYGMTEFTNLASHNKQNATRQLSFLEFHRQMNIIFNLAVTIFDRILFLSI